MAARRHPALVCLLVCAVALGGGACAGAPKETERGKRQILSTTYDDERVGREASQAVAVQMGLSGDPRLEAYVQELGNRLLRGVPRRGFDYRFAVVDQWEPNAFALPGGYVFIARGLIALANTEDELANVIGHEITHAARRHAAAQQALAARILPISMNAQIQMAAYGRDMEREADKGGQLLSAAAGYDPMGMSTFLTDLGNVERLTRGSLRMPSFSDTHPTSTERAAANAARAREIRWRPDPALGDTHVRHLRRIDGMAVGQRPEAGVFVGDDFIHPEMDFRIRFPHGWHQANQNTQVGAMSLERDAVVFLEADAQEGDPRLMAQAWLEKNRDELRLDVDETQPVQIGAIDSWRLELTGRSPSGSLYVLAVFIPYRGATLRVTGMTPMRRADRYRGRLLAVARSFRPLDPQQRASVSGERLRVVEARPGEDVAALCRRTGNAWDPSTTAVYNGVFVDHRFEGGELVKTVRVEPYTPAR